MITRNLESTLCLINWVFFALYSLYLFSTGIEGVKDRLDPRDLEEGWFASRLRDVTDVEWHVFKHFNSKYYFIFIGHILVTQTTWKYAPQLSLSAIIAYGTFSLWILFGFTLTFIIWINIFVAFLVHILKRPLFCHLFFILVLILSQRTTFRNLFLWSTNYDPRKLFLFEVLFGWLNAKCLSFCLDRIETCRRWQNPYSDDGLTMVYAYCLYFPTLFFGPMHQYSSFLTNMVFRADWNSGKFISSLVNLGRFSIYAIVYDLLNHYIYSTSLAYRVDLINELDLPTLCGFAYSLVIMFYLKYLVMYGYSETFGDMDGITLPPPPKCVSTIHLSSDLWRHFDRGLHLWLGKYYYKPLLAIGSNIFVKFSATSVCFAMVAVWHALSSDVIIWCTLNFCTVAIELTGLYVRHLFLPNFNTRLSPQAVRRCKSLMAAPFYIIMIITNTFFLANTEVGLLLFKKVLFSFPFPVLPILFISYTACHVSLELKDS